MPRTPTLPALIPAAGSGTTPELVALLTKAAIASAEQTDDIVAMLEELRRNAPRDYIAALVAVAKLGVEVPQHTDRNFTVISAIPRSKLDELPPHMQSEKTVN
jgi:hypothetical protein